MTGVTGGGVGAGGARRAALHTQGAVGEVGRRALGHAGLGGRQQQHGGIAGKAGS